MYTVYAISSSLSTSNGNNPTMTVCNVYSISWRASKVTMCDHKHKPAQWAPTTMKNQAADPESSSTQHGAGVRRHLETGLVVVCTAVQQRHTGCTAGAFLQYVSTLSSACLTLEKKHHKDLLWIFCTFTCVTNCFIWLVASSYNKHLKLVIRIQNLAYFCTKVDIYE